jgi:hypothetical protein
VQLLDSMRAGPAEAVSFDGSDYCLKTASYSNDYEHDENYEPEVQLSCYEGSLTIRYWTIRQ